MQGCGGSSLGSRWLVRENLQWGIALSCYVGDVRQGYDSVVGNVGMLVAAGVGRVFTGWLLTGANVITRGASFCREKTAPGG